MQATARAERPQPARDARAAAREYIGRGWAPVPVPTRSKNPGRASWQHERHAIEDVDRVFAPDGNIGLLLGGPSNGLADIDLDTTEAVNAAPFFLPTTDRWQGRASRRRSHAFYYVTDEPSLRSIKHIDPTRGCLVELRSFSEKNTPLQTIVYPSLHDETGELIEWEGDGEPARVTASTLRTAVAKIAACALVASRWVDGVRHQAALPLAGLLLRGGMQQHDAERFVEAVARVAEDCDWRDRTRCVTDTAAALARNEVATGGPRLAELLSDGQAVVGKLREWLGLAPIADVADTPACRVLDLAEFLCVEFSARENIMDPVFPRQGLGMVHAWRGLGKTRFASSFGLVAAAGAHFLKWRAHRPWRVLYLDGEMRGSDMQMILASLVKAMNPRPDPSFFRIITPDLQERGIPDLGTTAGQRWLDTALSDRDFIILDNLSSLVRSGSDKEDEPWLPLLGWLLRLRASGKSALLVHHDGKNETQRGTSRREDNLDTVFHLKKPRNYKASDGARFVVHFKKHRGFYGSDAEPFEAALTETEHGALEWSLTDIEDALTVQVVELLNDGCSVSEIAKELAIGRATVDRHKKKAIERGLYNGQ
jgi:hypothetical protein